LAVELAEQPDLLVNKKLAILKSVSFFFFLRMSGRYESEIQPVIDKILLDPKNLATPLELEQQAKACQAALLRADRDGNQIITIDEIGTLCEILGLPLQDNEDSIFLTKTLLAPWNRLNSWSGGFDELVNFQEIINNKKS
jgi:hypothetical protein